MDNLQWFKFSPADWMMGRIQRQPAQVQVDFLRVCCQYWKNEGNYSIEDAKLEAMDSYDVLVKYKIIKENNDNVFIEFLDEQLDDIEDKRKQASEAGKRSAEARKRRTESNDRSTTVKQPFNEPSTESNRVEKRRVEKSREDKEQIKQMFDEFWEAYDKKTGRTNAEKKWSNLSQGDRELILQHVPKYVKATPDKQYRKNPTTYLNQKAWLDEDLPSNGKQVDGRSDISDDDLLMLKYTEVREIDDKETRLRYCDLKGIKKGSMDYRNIVETSQSIAF